MYSLKKNISTLTQQYLIGALIFIMTVAVCVAPNTGDTLNYASDAVNAHDPLKIGSFQKLWEFGHLLWRPLAALLTPIVLSIVPDSIAWTPLLKVAWGLTALNLLSGMLICSLLYALTLKFTHSWKASAFILLLVVWSNAFLLYSQSGSSYVFALLFEVIALHLQLIADDTPSLGNDVLTGLSMGTAVLFWFPFILMFPAIATARWLIKGQSSKDGIRHFFLIGLTGFVFVAAGLAIGSLSSNAPSIAEWVSNSQHGLKQDRRLIRAVNGIPRLLVDMSNSGILLKRYVFHDPYNPVSKWDIVSLCFSKLFLFYSIIAVVAIQAWFWRPARKFLLLCMVAALPLLFFAVFLFEPSAPERFLPLLPFLTLLWSGVWPSDSRWAKPMRVAFVALSVLVIVNNAGRFWRGDSREERSIIQRLTALDAVASPGDYLFTVTFSEPQVTLMEQRPFHPYNRNRKVATYQLVELANKNAAKWRSTFAELVLPNWQTHRIWLSKSVRDKTPRSQINWVEGDNPLVPWAAFPEVFSDLEYDSETADVDGYIRLSLSQSNREKVERLLEQ